MKINDILARAPELGASDVHLTPGSPPAYRVNGELLPLGAPEWQQKFNLETGTEKVLSDKDIHCYCRELMNEKQYGEFVQAGECDFSYSLPGAGRFRVNAYKRQGAAAVAARLINSRVYSFYELGLPPVLENLSRKSRGLVLVTGPAGSGKSTTLASMIDLINSEYRKHIITLEDPVEYVHVHKKSIVNQREIGSDSPSFARALRASLREDPDVILVGEMRDPDTIATAITAAETGHLVVATLHTSGAARAVDRIIDAFPPYQQQQVRIQLAGTLQGIVAQQLVPRKDNNGRVAAVEVMTATPAIGNLIREGRTHQVVSQIQAGARFGMQTMDSSLLRFYKEQLISREEYTSRAAEPGIPGDTGEISDV